MITKSVNVKRTRLAPTPSGFLHLGNLYSFTITVGLARQLGASILLRIDDMDQERANPECIQDIFDTLHFLEIPWDEGPRDFIDFQNNYSQVHRVHLYEKFLNQLMAQNAIYPCTCSRSQIRRGTSTEAYPGTCRDKSVDLQVAEAALRLKTNPEKRLQVKNTRGDITEHYLPPSMCDFIIQRKDRFVAYQLASLADDIFYEVDLVVRGEDLWPSTLAQQYLASCLGSNNFSDCTFYHHSVLKDENGNKLSKSANATSVRYMRQQGYNAKDIYQHLAHLLNIESPVNNWETLFGKLNPLH